MQVAPLKQSHITLQVMPAEENNIWFHIILPLVAGKCFKGKTQTLPVWLWANWLLWFGLSQTPVLCMAPQPHCRELKKGKCSGTGTWPDPTWPDPTQPPLPHSQHKTSSLSHLNVEWCGMNPLRIPHLWRVITSHFHVRRTLNNIRSYRLCLCLQRRKDGCVTFMDEGLCIYCGGMEDSKWICLEGSRGAESHTHCGCRDIIFWFWGGNASVCLWSAEDSQTPMKPTPKSHRKGIFTLKPNNHLGIGHLNSLFANTGLIFHK